MKRLIAFGASILVNVVLLGAVGWNAYLADNTPPGHVSVTQLDGSDSGPLLAGVAS